MNERDLSRRKMLGVLAGVPAATCRGTSPQETPGYHLKAEVALRDVDPVEYAGMFVSGGRAPEYLRYDQVCPGLRTGRGEVHR